MVLPEYIIIFCQLQLTYFNASKRYKHHKCVAIMIPKDIKMKKPIKGLDQKKKVIHQYS